ncbi:alanine:cation symporter family protein [bacterium]|jgi:alanine or glycine:cation symporter, AGCS family|nr:alanine:cation symporter family protein [bacterium]
MGDPTTAVSFLGILDNFFAASSSFVWSKIVFWASLIGGIYFTLRFMFVQFRSVPHAIDLAKGKFDEPNEVGQITHFQALTAALSGTIGLGNIAGVAIAIALGGPGTVFWMWLIGIFGMATKFVECTLGTHYREVNEETGEIRGGPMYYISKGLGSKWKPMAAIYAVSIMIAALGAGCMFQTNQAASAMFVNYNIPLWASGLALFALGALVILGGIQRISKVTEKIVPGMCIIYVLGSLIICIMNFSQIPAALSIILTDAFTGSAVGGGFLYTAMMGIRRAIFSNEAGLGSASIAHAAVKTNYPIREGFVAALGPFVDTVIVCSATAFVIIMAGNFGSEMYQTPSNDQTVQFSSSKNIIQKHESWKVSETNIPESTNSFKTFTESDVLSVKSTGNEPVKQAVTLEKMSIGKDESANGLRFSYYQGSGDMSVRFFKPDGKLIDEIKLSKMPSSTKKLKLEGTQKVNEWESRIILFDDSFKEEVLTHSENGDFHVQFVAQEGNVEWFIDRVQPVVENSGVDLTTASFDKFFKGFGKHFITISVFFFAFSTMITWAYYGETAAGYIFGKTAITIYKWFFVSMAFVGSITSLSTVVNFSDLSLGLAVIPNMIAIVLLSGKVKKWLKTYYGLLKSGKMKPSK